MKPSHPTKQDIQELVSFLPRLHEDGFDPVKETHGGEPNEDGVISMPWTEYDGLVLEFFRLAGRNCWNDRKYRPEEAGRMLSDRMFVRTATLSQIKTMLTFCVRGERFCDGHWAAMIKSGDIRQILKRLTVLYNEE